MSQEQKLKSVSLWIFLRFIQSLFSSVDISATETEILNVIFQCDAFTYVHLMGSFVHKDLLACMF